MLAFRLAILTGLAISLAGPAAAREYREPDESALDRHGHYRSHDGSTVHQPARTRDGTRPDGATARCRDGSWSFSHSRSGTCSRHGGVASWN